MRYILSLIVFSLMACGNASAASLREGVYRGELTLKEGVVLPFNFNIAYRNGKPVMTIFNAAERITADEISIAGDSAIIRMPAFDTEFRTRVTADGLSGVWINHYRTSSNVLMFRAAFGEARRFYSVADKAASWADGKWEATFSPNTADSSKAVAIFRGKSRDGSLEGTFLTETGDYRYLQGIQDGNKLYLSTFNGSWAFLFTATLENNVLKGRFFSGSHWSEEWTAKRNEKFTLRNADSITRAVDPAAAVELSLPDSHGMQVTLSQEPYLNKPVIIQIMGTWCPNCLDEGRYLSSLHTKYNRQGLEVIAIAFEKTEDPVKASELVERFRKRMGINYPVLITGRTGKNKAAAMLPFLTGISAFPTAVFLNRQHKIVRIHTGFSGPATGSEYDHFRKETEGLVKKLLNE
jgi:thiol-disulfide isomerase/thioredoxin